MFSNSNPTEQDNSPDRLSLTGQAKAVKRHRFWRKTQRGILWILCLAVVGYLSAEFYATTQLKSEVAEIRQKGEPVQFAEMEPPPVPDAQNAALVYQQATASLLLSNKVTSVLQIRDRKLTTQEVALLEGALRNNQKALELARRAASMPQCRFAVDWKGDPSRVTFPYYRELRGLARILAADAQMQAKNGDRDTALRDVRAVFGMGHHLSREPFFIGFLVAQSVDAIAHRSLEQVLEQVALDVAQAHAFEASLPQDDWTRSFRDSLVGERTFSLSAFENLGKRAPNDGDEDSSDGPVWTKYPLLSIARPLIKLDEVQTLRMWKLWLDSPEAQQVPISAAFVRAQDAALQDVPSYAQLTRILFPVFGRASDNRDNAEVRRRQRRVALALACFHTARGHYPAQLQQAATLWGKPLPLDPYSQKPFVYLPSGNSFVLYSVGVNRVNDGGKLPPSLGKYGGVFGDDLVWSNP